MKKENGKFVKFGIGMKKFVVLMIKDESNLFDLFNQTEILGIKNNINEAKILVEEVKNNIISKIEEHENEDEEIEFSIEESNEGRKITIYDGEEGTYYNLMIKEF